MVIEGPSLENSIPKGSIIICPNVKCRAYILKINVTIEVASLIFTEELTGLVNPIRKRIRISPACPKCGVFFLRHNKTFLYIPPPRSLGDQITNFMYWDENNAANR
jgi:hypothetical protein